MEANSFEQTSSTSTGSEKNIKRSVVAYFAGIAGAVLLVVFGSFFLLSTAEGEVKSGSILDREYAELDLDVLHREVPVQLGGDTSETFICQPILVLNGDIEDLSVLHKKIERRKNTLRGELFRILYTLPTHYFRNRDLLARISHLFLKAVNGMLGPNPEGKAT